MWEKDHKAMKRKCKFTQAKNSIYFANNTHLKNNDNNKNTQIEISQREDECKHECFDGYKVICLLKWIENENETDITLIFF